MTDEGGKDQYASQQHIRQEDEDGGFAMMNMNRILSATPIFACPIQAIKQKTVVEKIKR